MTCKCKIDVKVKRLNDSAIMPKFAHDGDAGADLYAIDEYCIPSGKTVMVKTGICIEIPVGYEAQIRPRSGLAAKNGITVLNTPGTIDCQYRGEICVLMYNTSEKEFLIEPGMRIAQMVINKLPAVVFTEVDDLGETERGSGGFGSSGTK